MNGVKKCTHNERMPTGHVKPNYGTANSSEKNTFETMPGCRPTRSPTGNLY